jgi:uncharacterized protein (TIGR03118 family)
MHASSNRARARRMARAALAAVALQLAVPGVATAQNYFQRNLVSDIAGLAELTDPALRNPWGMSFSRTSPFWISDQGANLSTLYTVSDIGVTKVPLQVSIPAIAGGPQGPTGQVNNGTGAFALANGTAARFMFANLDGSISGWNGGTAAEVVVPASAGTIYTGLAINTDPTLGPLLYAANTAGGEIEVYDGSFNELTMPPDAFVDPDAVAAGLVPFNVQSIGGNVYVTYAEPGRPAQIAAGRGSGAVAVFDTAGNFISTVISGSRLASPWGLALAPSNFGLFSGDLLVGNFSFAASEINAFDPTTGALRGTLPIDMTGFAPGGLWALAFGNGASGAPNVLYFTDGINGERNGLFAAFGVPEPHTLLLFAGGLVAVALTRRASPSSPRKRGSSVVSAAGPLLSQG